MSEADKKNNGEAPKDFGRVIDALHDKNKLSALRTYQGDVAEFIKQKNLSVTSIAVQEKERRQEREDKKNRTEAAAKAPAAPQKGGFKANLTLVLISLLLVAGGVVAFVYAGNILKTGPAPETVLEKSLLPYNNSVTLAAVSKEGLLAELSKGTFAGGVTLIKISGPDGQPLARAKDFFDFLQAALPAALSRNLKNDYMVGVLSQNGQYSPFIIITVSDFGGAFAGLLDWEEDMESDLAFLQAATKNDMTSLLSSSTTIPYKAEEFAWKDLIVKNKDTRGLVSSRGKSKAAYTFLDKNTVLITGGLSAVGEITSIYASRAVAR